MKLTDRPYQTDCLEAIEHAWQVERRRPFVLCVAATGSGKTVIFSKLIRRHTEHAPVRALILAHRKTLVSQAAKKLKAIWPDAPVSVACKSISSRVDLRSQIVVASKDTLVRRLDKIDIPFNLIIIDEVHRMPPIELDESGTPIINSSYAQIIFDQWQKAKALNIPIVILGFTATPYRLIPAGYIYGDEPYDNHRNWFSTVHFEISIDTLQDQGFLAQTRMKILDEMEKDLVKVKKHSNDGDYNTKDLEKLVTKEVHIAAAVKAYRTYGESRRHVIAFCVTIKHAELVRDAFNEAGLRAACVHSNLKKHEIDQILTQFETGEIQVLTSVEKISEGWDAPCVDLILLCRPTKSTSLYVQMCGRGTRLSPDTGKTDALILDLAGCYNEHGNFKNPIVNCDDESEKKQRRESEVQFSVCQSCLNTVERWLTNSQIESGPDGQPMCYVYKECPHCHSKYKSKATELVDLDAPVQMRDVNEADNSGAPFLIYVTKITPSEHQSKAGNRLLRLVIQGRTEGNDPVTVYEYLDPEAILSEWRKEYFGAWWQRFAIPTAQIIPSNIAIAVARFPSLRLPKRITVRRQGKFLNVFSWRDETTPTTLEPISTIPQQQSPRMEARP